MSVLFPDENPPLGATAIPKEPLPSRNEKVEAPPRKVTLGLQGKFAALALLVALWGFLWSCLPVIRSGARVSPFNLIFFAGMLVIAMPIALKATFRAFWEWELLRTGASSWGKVLSQQRIGSWSFKKTVIIYEFPVGGHKPMMGRGTDWTRNYKADKSVLVFYDPQDISRYVAFCSTGWRVHSSSGTILEP